MFVHRLDNESIVFGANLARLPVTQNETLRFGSTNQMKNQKFSEFMKHSKKEQFKIINWKNGIVIRRNPGELVMDILY